MAGAVAEPTFQLTFGADLRNSLVTSWGLLRQGGQEGHPGGSEGPGRAGVRPRAALPPALRAEQGQEAGATFNNGRIAMNVAGSFAYGGSSAGRSSPASPSSPGDPGGRRQTGNATGYSITEGSKNKPRVGVRQVAGGGQRAGAPGRDHHPPRRGLPQDTPPEVTRVFFEALKTGLYFPP